MPRTLFLFKHEDIIARGSLVLLAKKRLRQSRNGRQGSTQILALPTVPDTLFTEELQLSWYLVCRTGPNIFQRQCREYSLGSEKHAGGMQGTGNCSLIETVRFQVQKQGKKWYQKKKKTKKVYLRTKITQGP